MTTRRSFLAQVLALASLSALGCSPEVQASTLRALPQPGDLVAVVGAGVSGLTVARALLLAGYDVVVIEARDRIGGRTHTIDLAGTPIDAGGSWIHGVRRSPLADLVDALGLQRSQDNSGYGPIVHETDGPLGPWVSGAVLATFGDFTRDLRRLRNVLGPGATVADGVQRYIADHNLGPQVERGFRYLVGLTVETDYSGPMHRTSLDLFWEDSGFGGGDWYVHGGYRELVDELADGLDIRLSTPVDRIEWNGQRVRLHGPTGVLNASHAIVTVPLGVLRAGSITFDPPLPARKRRAIRAVGMGNLEKVIFRFDDAFWNGAGGGLFIADQDGAWPSWFDYSPFAGAPALACHYGGSFARQTQGTLTDSEIVAEALDALSILLDMPIPAPLETYVTHWTIDPYAGGSYSFPTVGSTLADRDALAAPANDRLLFAGEATMRDASSTVHGALMSGLREASRFGISPDVMSLI